MKSAQPRNEGGKKLKRKRNFKLTLRPRVGDFRVDPDHPLLLLPDRLDLPVRGVLERVPGRGYFWKVNLEKEKRKGMLRFGIFSFRSLSLFLAFPLSLPHIFALSIFNKSYLAVSCAFPP